ncbi:hypothetical protein RO3G_00863 [Rhizopus delemar RA 99-880]|uniref:Reverse transcriptase domain-containing protein n=1 Tax=Rhizopus delemar (strain RA 99-880 / ATCC MYA-4621 / FGSC 9543 / NRRL 43880) TaxID=246409 RepID=I1BIX9_RHIO9|nr:hypothetical protein RO3G_00863 [Rhizopus delemar RA 99-880]|eukprot:EIE76159.1 hypothetical protein RO3G_00863 [Rhizopus delemar RA 99-880]
MVMEHARRSGMLKFGFPSVLINSIIGLLFGNRVRININGHFTNEINQCRGLRQGDPLSPLLFNLVLEPFLRHIIQDNAILGFSFIPLSSNIPPPPDLKVLAYADDVCVFLSSPEDFVRVQYHLHLYGQVSDAKVNLLKTEAIFLNGCASSSWQQTLLQYRVVKWHNHTKPRSLRYLGLPVIQSLAQPLPEEPTSDITNSTDETYNEPGPSSTYDAYLQSTITMYVRRTFFFVHLFSQMRYTAKFENGEG